MDSKYIASIREGLCEAFQIILQLAHQCPQFYTDTNMQNDYKNYVSSILQSNQHVDRRRLQE